MDVPRSPGAGMDEMPLLSWWRAEVSQADPQWPFWYTRGVHVLDGGRGAFVYFRCPNGHVLQVSRAVHSIAADGTCSPSFVCVSGTAAGCSFHEFVRLLDWVP